MTGALVAFGMFSCEEDETPKSEPTCVVIKSISAITDSAFTVNAEVSGDGVVVARGVILTLTSVASKPGAPADTLYDDAGGNGFFTLVESRLTPNTNYYVRAFAKEEGGEFFFSEEQTATTKEHVGTSIVLSSATSTDDSLVVKFAISGEDAIISRGVYFSTQPIDKANLKDLTPTMAAEGGKEEFEFVFDKLFRNTEYHVLAFAKDDKGAIIYSDDYTERTTATAEGYILVDAENGESAVSLTLTTNDPLSSVILKKGNTDINGEVKELEAKDGIYSYTAVFSELAEGQYVIVAKTTTTTKEAEAQTGRYRLDYTESSIDTKNGVTTYHYLHNGKIGSIRVSQIGTSSLFTDLNEIVLDNGTTIDLSSDTYVSEDGSSSVREPDDYLFKIVDNGNGYTLMGNGVTLFTKGFGIEGQE